jgi:hypothetical protein
MYILCPLAYWLATVFKAQDHMDYKIYFSDYVDNCNFHPINNPGHSKPFIIKFAFLTTTRPCGPLPVTPHGCPETSNVAKAHHTSSPHGGGMYSVAKQEK